MCDANSTFSVYFLHFNNYFIPLTIYSNLNIDSTFKLNEIFIQTYCMKRNTRAELKLILRYFKEYCAIKFKLNIFFLKALTDTNFIVIIIIRFCFQNFQYLSYSVLFIKTSNWCDEYRKYRKTKATNP